MLRLGHKYYTSPNYKPVWRNHGCFETIRSPLFKTLSCQKTISKAYPQGGEVIRPVQS